MDDPDDLKVLTEVGLIWKTPYAQRAVDAIRAGDIALDDCRDIPPQIAAALNAEMERRATL